MGGRGARAPTTSRSGGAPPARGDEDVGTQLLLVEGSFGLHGWNTLPYVPKALAQAVSTAGCGAVAPQELHRLATPLRAQQAAWPAEATSLTVHGDLKIEDCERLEKLPRRVIVKGSMHVHRCKHLRSFPCELVVGQDLYVCGCESLPSLVTAGSFLLPTTTLRVGGSTVVSRCRQLEALPDMLYLGGDLRVNDCPNLVRLPTHIREAPLDIHPDDLAGRWHSQGRPTEPFSDGASRVDHQKDSTSAPGRRRSGRVSSVPSSDKRTADMGSRASGTSVALPLSVPGSLILVNCSALEALPEGLQIGGTLNLSGCRSLVCLPSNLRVAGDLNLHQCTSMQYLPNSFLNLFPRLYNNRRKISLLGSGIPPGIQRLVARFVEERDRYDLIVHISNPDAEHVQFMDLEQALFFWYTYTHARDQQSALDFASEMAKPLWWHEHCAGRGEDEWVPDAEAIAQRVDGVEMKLLVDFLTSLTATAEFQNLRTRAGLAKTILALVRSMQTATHTCRQITGCLVKEVNSGSPTAPMKLLKRLGVIVQIEDCKTSRAPRDGLGKLVDKLHVQQLVEEYAGQQMHSQFVDRLDVVVSMQVRLADVLGMPWVRPFLLHNPFDDPTGSEVSDAIAKVVKKFKDPEDRARYIAEHPPLKEALQETDVLMLLHQLGQHPVKQTQQRINVRNTCDAGHAPTSGETCEATQLLDAEANGSEPANNAPREGGSGHLLEGTEELPKGKSDVLPLATLEDGVYWEVEQLLDHRASRRKKASGKRRQRQTQYEFLVRWVGYDEPSWEPMSSITSVAIEQYCDERGIDKRTFSDDESEKGDGMGIGPPDLVEASSPDVDRAVEGPREQGNKRMSTDERLWEVDNLLAHRWKRRKKGKHTLEFLVQWTGWTEPTWEPEDHITDVTVEQYLVDKRLTYQQLQEQAM